MITVPEDFRCPISLEVMNDPVILPTGQTYDRTSIQLWFDSGQRVCPNTKIPLQDTTLIPNYALRSLIHQWARTHNVPLKRSPTANANPGISPSLRSRLTHLSRSLHSHCPQARKDAIREIRTLGKQSPEIRSAIMKSGMLTGIFTLMPDPVTEEHASTVVFYLSLDEGNKEALLAGGAIAAVGSVLRRGSMDARCAAAVTLSSLATVSANKVIIGRHVDVFDSLVLLVQEGNTRAKREAVNCLYSLCLSGENRKRAVKSGAARVAIGVLEGCGTSEEVVERTLGLLSMLCAVGEARELVAREGCVERLVGFMKEGCVRVREYAAAVLSSVVCTSEACARVAREAGAMELCAGLLEGGGMRTKRKVFALAKAMEDC